MIVALLAEKGGTGKTTLAANLAGMRATSGSRVLLVDADRQGSAYFWAQTRENLRLPRVESAALHGPALARHLRIQAERFDDLIIDTGAGDGQEMEAALLAADCAVVPIQPAGLDVWTMGLMDSRISQASEENSKLEAWAVLNRASHHPLNQDVAQAKSALSQCAALRVAESVICDRVAVRRSITQGRTVDEFRPRSPRAEEEMAAVYELVFGDQWPPAGWEQGRLVV